MTKRKPSPYSYTQTLSRYINAESYLFYVVSTYTGPHAKSSVPVIDMNHLFFFESTIYYKVHMNHLRLVN